MSDPQGLLAEKKAFDDAATALSRLLKPGDTQIDYFLNVTAVFEETRVIALNPSGRYKTELGQADSPDETDELIAAISELRRASYRPGSGTWFSLHLTVTADGSATAKYNYDDEPEWDTPIDPVAYVNDAKKFPRDEAHQPEWLKQRLAEGQARIDGQS